MPSAKSRKQSAEAVPQGQSPVSQTPKDRRNAPRKQRAKATRLKRKSKCKEAMNLPTRLARLLKFKRQSTCSPGLTASEHASEAASAQSRGGTSLSPISGNSRNHILKGDHGSSPIGPLNRGYNLSRHQESFAGGRAFSTDSRGGGCGKDSDSGAAQFRLIPKERIIALDCEMVGVGPEGRQSALARCSIVDYDGSVVYDAYVRPELEIFHYRTPWSGIRAHHMRDAVPFRKAQQQIAAILRGKVLVGHSLRFDIQVLHIRHPAEDIRDTSSYPGLRQLAGLTLGRGQHPGLKKLTRLLFGHAIQTGEHCSVEDARATMNLYKLVESRWEEERVSAFPDGDFRASFMDDHFWPDDLDQ